MEIADISFLQISTNAGKRSRSQNLMCRPYVCSNECCEVLKCLHRPLAILNSACAQTWRRCLKLEALIICCFFFNFLALFRFNNELRAWPFVRNTFCPINLQITVHNDQRFGTDNELSRVGFRGLKLTHCVTRKYSAPISHTGKFHQPPEADVARHAYLLVT